ncbi:MAG: hypothetical protein L0K90_05205, partial [Staphylococcus equorum]|nr:hypothetical protein [Staphylococcus equorum]
MGVYDDKNIKSELKGLFNEEMIMDATQVADYLHLTKANILIHCTKGNLVPIYVWEIERTFRLFYYPDIVKFDKYKKEKKKSDGYERYHKEIQTAERQRVKQLIEQNIWITSQVC